MNGFFCIHLNVYRNFLPIVIPDRVFDDCHKASSLNEFLLLPGYVCISTLPLLYCAVFQSSTSSNVSRNSARACSRSCSEGIAVLRQMKKISTCLGNVSLLTMKRATVPGKRY